MSMRWRKLGCIYPVEEGSEPSFRFAANPVAIPLSGSQVRIYFGARDLRNRSAIHWLEVDLRQPKSIIACSTEPVLAPGELGCFDDSGCSMGSIILLEKQWYLYYLGWNLGVTVPWRNAIGLALSTDEGLSFSRVSRAPIMDRHRVDPFSLSYPWVLHKAGRWHMWYGSQLNWIGGKESMDHVLKEAHSLDGIEWSRNGSVVIAPDLQHRAFSRPCVVPAGDGYQMWYSYRGESYRIGYAESANGRDWKRLDHLAGIELGPSAWDDTMIEYPHVFDVEDARYMLYNGNGYGRTGFGLAILEQD